MTDLPISRELASKLQQLARDKGTPLEDMLSDFVTQNQMQNAVPAATMLNFTEALEELNLHSGQSDIASDFDNYVQQAIADHFKNHSKED